MSSQNKKPARVNSRLRVACIVVAAILVIGAVMALVKPPMSDLVERIPEEMVDRAGANYSQTEYNYLIFNIARGRNVRTAESDTYIGIFGMVIQINDGFPAKLANMLFWLPALLSGARITISLTIVSMLAGVFLSVFLALGKISKIKLISKPCSAYIFFFRGTPLLMQLFFVYYALPMMSTALTINDKFTAAFVAFALNNAAYCAEIIRAAIQSIDKGQFEVSHALGLTYAQTMRLVIIPQSFRRLIPPVANEFIMVLKDVSLVSLIALSDLTHTTRSINSSSSSVLVFIPAMIIYLVITAFFTFVFNRLEKRFSVYQ
ncbi:MAG: amino acid ABC transporter permease [Oscillospiraceae bacterium]|nr:amino acid ABC transporter permease [Oscillospiraceae bacterium]